MLIEPHVAPDRHRGLWPATRGAPMLAATMRLPVTIALVLSAALFTASPAHATTLTLTKPAFGHVTSTPTAVDCGAGCTTTTVPVPSHFECDEHEPQPHCHRVNFPITLDAQSEDGVEPTGWNGCTTTAGPLCTVDVDASVASVSVGVSFADVAAPHDARVTAPAGGTYRGAIALRAAAEDNVGVTAVTYYGNGKPLGQATTPPYGLSLDTTKLADGPLALTVTATDAAQHTSPPSPAVTVTIDNTPPAVSFVAGPGAEPPTRERNPTFLFNAGDATSVLCGLDSAVLRACDTLVTQSYNGLADGPHILHIEAHDAAGNTSTLAHAFRVDTAAPAATITAGLADGAKTSDRGARFEFASEPGARFECRLDAASFVACAGTASYSGLQSGAHSFAVRAIDVAGNVQATPTSRTWMVVNDLDGDRYDAGPDCNDHDATIHPGAADIADDGVDEDCDGHDAINLDRDRDGYNRPQDCDDANPRINPGAYDTPGDAVDEDCDGTAAPTLRLAAKLFMAYRLIGRSTRITRLAVREAPAGTAVAIRCQGRLCPFTSKRFATRADGALNLTRALQGRALPGGIRIEIAITRPQMVGLWTRYTLRAGKAPTRLDRCLAPGTAKPSACL